MVDEYEQKWYHICGPVFDGYERWNMQDHVEKNFVCMIVCDPLFRLWAFENQVFPAEKTLSDIVYQRMITRGTMLARALGLVQIAQGLSSRDQTQIVHVWALHGPRWCIILTALSKISSSGSRSSLQYKKIPTSAEEIYKGINEEFNGFEALERQLIRPMLQERSVRDIATKWLSVEKKDVLENKLLPQLPKDSSDSKKTCLTCGKIILGDSANQHPTIEFDQPL
jgi:hypothetical protein